MNEVRLVRGRWIVTGGGAGDAVLDDAAIVLRGERIEALGAWQDLRRRYPQAGVIGSDRVAVLPGLRNAALSMTPMVVLVALVALSGAVWVWLATVFATRGPLLSALREE